jgi:hypothetical protein
MSKVTLDSQQMADLAVGLSAAVRWYSQAVEGYANEDSANPGKLHFQQQLDRLRELQKLMTSNPTGCVEVSLYPTPPGP